MTQSKTLLAVVVAIVVMGTVAVVGLNHSLTASGGTDQDEYTHPSGVDVVVTVEGDASLEYPVNIEFTRLIDNTTTYTRYRVYRVSEGDSFSVTLQPDATYAVVIDGANNTSDTLHKYRAPSEDGELILRDVIDESTVGS